MRLFTNFNYCIYVNLSLYMLDILLMCSSESSNDGDSFPRSKPHNRSSTPRNQSISSLMHLEWDPYYSLARSSLPYAMRSINIIGTVLGISGACRVSAVITEINGQEETDTSRSRYRDPKVDSALN